MNIMKLTDSLDAKPKAIRDLQSELHKLASGSEGVETDERIESLISSFLSDPDSRVVLGAVIFLLQAPELVSLEDQHDRLFKPLIESDDPAMRKIGRVFYPNLNNEDSRNHINPDRLALFIRTAINSPNSDVRNEAVRFIASVPPGEDRELLFAEAEKSGHLDIQETARDIKQRLEEIRLERERERL